jgi:hypothetical protein
MEHGNLGTPSGNHDRLNDPGNSILVRKYYNFARYLNLTFTDLENNANLLFKN